MLIGVPKEIKNNEFRIGLTPKSTQVLIQQNHEESLLVGAGPWLCPLLYRGDPADEPGGRPGRHAHTARLCLL